MPNSDRDSTSSQAVTRQELYDVAWRMPTLRVAERFGVSSSYLARVFTELRIPRPAPGYWAQVEFGKSPAKPSLPPARPGELTEWSPGTSVGVTVNNTKEQFDNSPDLDKELEGAIMDALAAHSAMSKQALESAALTAGLKAVLLGAGRLWEGLRERASGGSSIAQQ